MKSCGESPQLQCFGCSSQNAQKGRAERHSWSAISEGSNYFWECVLRGNAMYRTLLEGVWLSE